MKKGTKIVYLERNKIDNTKWNEVINTSKVGSIYNYTYVLDALFPKWSALMIGDYDYIFPITLSKKWGITYFYPPLFHSYFSIFSSKTITQEIQTEFFEALNNYCSFYEFPFLTLNHFTFPTNVLVQPKVGQLIKLNNTSTIRHQKYTKHLIRNLKKSESFNLRFEVNNNLIQEVVQTFKQNVGHKIKELTPSSYEALTCFIQATISEEKGRIYACYSKDQLLAIGFFSFANDRIIYHKGGNTSEGKKISAMSALINHVLDSYSSCSFCFDFGGSSIPSIIKYNQSFGAENHTFFTLKRTPYFIQSIKFLKKIISFKNRLAKTK